MPLYLVVVKFKIKWINKYLNSEGREGRAFKTKNSL